MCLIFFATNALHNGCYEAALRTRHITWPQPLQLAAHWLRLCLTLDQRRVITATATSRRCRPALTQQRVIKPPAWTCDATNESFQSPCHNIILTKSFDRRVRIENLVAGRPGRTQGLVGLQPKVLDINIIQRAFAYSRVCGKVCFMASARDAVAFITKCNNATLGFSIFSRHLASTIELLSVTTDLWRILCYPWYLDYTA